MIAFFPELYPDELLYSWFARYYVKAGTRYRVFKRIKTRCSGNDGKTV